jgi:hypothetical protein
MGLLRTDRSRHPLKAGRRRPVRLCAEELEPRTLLSAALPAGLAHTTFELFRPDAHGPGHGGHGPGGPGGGGFAPGYNPGQSPAGYWPAQLRHAYGFDKLSLDGTGQTIAIVDAYADPNIVGDLRTFDAQFNLPAPPSFSHVSQTGGDDSTVPTDSSGGWEVEEALDVEWAHAIAPKANIILFQANSNSTTDLLTAVDTARGTPGVVVVSMSWGGNEDPSETGGDSTFTTPTGHAGVTFLASSGDSGPPGGYPAMSPNVVAVGGTTLALDANDNRTSEVGWGGSGGGPSYIEPQPAYQAAYAQSAYVQGTLGNTLLLNNTARANPDVAYVSDPNPGVAMYDTYFNQFGIFGWAAVGGTSDAAPQWAALIALVDQGRGAGNSLDGATQTLPALYRLAASPTTYPNDFFDVTSGGNGYSPQAGYDYVTGLGGPRADHLIPDLIGNTGPASFSVTTSTGSPVAGAAFNVTVTALDSSGHTFTGYAGTVHFTSSDKGSGVVLPPDYTFKAGDGGVHTFTNEVTLVTAGGQTVTATDTANSGLSGTAGVTVSAAAASKLVLSAPASVVQGTPFSLTATAEDRFGNTVTGYLGTIHFTTSDTGTGVVLPADYPFTAGDNGSHTFTNAVTLVTVGPQTVTATDKANGTITGQASVSVTADVATHFSVSAPSGSTAGAAFSVTVTALDANNKTVSGYRGTVHFTSSDTGTGVVLPGDYPFTAGDAGVHTFSGVTLVTAGGQTVTATDTANSSVTGQAGVTVSAAAASTLTLSAPASVGAGSPFSLTVTAKDRFGNTATGYRGTVHFTTSDSGTGVVLPGDYPFTAGDGGAHTFSNGITLVTPGTQTVTATDTASSSITGQASVNVTQAQATHFSVSAPSGSTAGAAFSVTVTALDANNHVVTGYRGTVHFTTSDTGAGVVLPGDYSFTSGDGGAHTFAGGVTLVTAGNQTVTATDTGNSGVSGTATVTVSAAAARTFSVTGFPSPINAGAPGTFTVTALDAYGNVATGYSGTVTFSSSDFQAQLPGDSPLTQGTGTFSATLNTVGTQSITATDTINRSITGSQTGIQVTAPSGPAPVVTDVEPHSGSPGGGNFVVVYGQNLQNAVAVYFGTTPAMIVGDGPLTVDVIAPPHDPGTVDVTVVTTGGTSPTSSADLYTYWGASGPAVRLPGPGSSGGAGGSRPGQGGTSGTGPTGPTGPGTGAPPSAPTAAEVAAVDALMAQWAVDGITFMPSSVYGITGPSGPSSSPGGQNGTGDGTVFNLPSDGGPGATGADGVDLPGPPSARWRSHG